MREGVSTLTSLAALSLYIICVLIGLVGRELPAWCVPMTNHS